MSRKYILITAVVPLLALLASPASATRVGGPEPVPGAAGIGVQNTEHDDTGSSKGNVEITDTGMSVSPDVIDPASGWGSLASSFFDVFVTPGAEGFFDDCFPFQTDGRNFYACNFHETYLPRNLRPSNFTRLLLAPSPAAI